MKLNILYLFIFLLPSTLNAQEILEIPYEKASGEFTWSNTEEIQYWEEYDVHMITNISVPELVYYKSEKGKANTSAVVICPGGAFHGLNMEKEGNPVAKWLAENGVAAFVLKYRLIPTEGDALSEFVEKNEKKIREVELQKFRPIAISDGISAIDYIRDHSSSLGIDRNKIGIIGFSAGGTVAMGTVFQESGTSRPDFVAPIYPNLTPFYDMEIPKDAPPLFVCAASDDNYNTVPDCINIYNRWFEKGLSAEIHIYSTGGHDFGFRKDGNHINSWIERLGDWLTINGWF